MPEISRFFGIVIQMFKNEHPPPHLHAVYAEYIGVFNIASGELVEGKLPSRQSRLVRRWIEEHREELLENWHLLQDQQLPQRIAPLQRG